MSRIIYLFMLIAFLPAFAQTEDVFRIMPGYFGPVRFSNDCKKIATSNFIFDLEANDFKVITKSRTVYSYNFSQDNNELLSVIICDTSGMKINKLDLNNYKDSSFVIDTGEVLGNKYSYFIFSEDSKFVAALEKTKSIDIWETGTGSRIFHSDSLTGLWAYGIAFTPASDCLAGRNDTAMFFLDLKTMAVNRQIRMYNVPNVQIGFSRDGKRFFNAYYNYSNKLHSVLVYDSEKGGYLSRIQPYSTLGKAIFNSEGNRVFTLTDNITAWDAISEDSIYSVKTYFGNNYLNPSMDYCSCNDKEYLAYGAERLYLIDAKTGDEVKKITPFSYYVSAQFNSDGKYYLAQDLEGIKIFETQTGELIKTDTSYLLSKVIPGTDYYYNMTDSMTVEIRSIVDNKLIEKYNFNDKVVIHSFSNGAKLLKYHPYGSNTFEIMDFENRKDLFDIDPDDQIIFSPDNKNIAIKDYSSGTWYIKDIKKGDSVFVWNNTQRRCSVKYSNSGNELLIIDESQKDSYRLKIFVYNINFRSIKDSLEISDCRDFLNFTGDCYIIFKEYGSFGIYDIVNKKFIKEYMPFLSDIGISASPDGKYIMTSNYDKTLILWTTPFTVDVDEHRYEDRKDNSTAILNLENGILLLPYGEGTEQEVTIYSINGIKVYRAIPESDRIDVGFLSKGVYFARSGNRLYKFMK